MHLLDKSTQLSDPDSLTPAVRRLAYSILMTDEEVGFFEGLQTNRMSFEPRDTIIRDGQEFEACYALVSGWAIAYRVTASGRRQIVNVLLPGDFLGLHTNFHRSCLYTCAALTSLEVAVIEPMRLLEIYQKYPVLATGLDWATVRSFNILSEHNVSLGARSAEQRILHFYLELWCRLALIGEADEDGFAMPMTQEQVADAMGLTPVHTNRVLRRMQKEGIIEAKNRFVSFPDPKRAAMEADFDARFLQGLNKQTSSVERDRSVEKVLSAVAS